MPYSSTQLNNQIFNCDINIHDGIDQLNQYMENPSLLNHVTLKEQLPLIENVDIIETLKVCENTINIFSEFQMILNNEDKRRKYKGLMTETEKKSIARKSNKKSRQEKKRILIHINQE